MTKFLSKIKTWKPQEYFTLGKVLEVEFTRAKRSTTLSGLLKVSPLADDAQGETVVIQVTCQSVAKKLWLTLQPKDFVAFLDLTPNE